MQVALIAYLIRLQGKVSPAMTASRSRSMPAARVFTLFTARLRATSTYGTKGPDVADLRRRQSAYVRMPSVRGELHAQAPDPGREHTTSGTV